MDKDKRLDMILLVSTSITMGRLILSFNSYSGVVAGSKVAHTQLRPSVEVIR